jgi:hypothetical protein
MYYLCSFFGLRWVLWFGTGVIFVMLCIHGIIVCGDVKSIALLDDEVIYTWYLCLHVCLWLMCSVVMSSL